MQKDARIGELRDIIDNMKKSHEKRVKELEEALTLTNNDASG